MTLVAANYHDLIQQTLVGAARAHQFPEYAVDPRTGLRLTSAKRSRPPRSAQAYLDSTLNSEPARQRRTGYLREIERQTWFLIVGFDVAVDTWTFEETLRRSPPSIPRDTSLGRSQQVDLLLEEVNYRVPVSQQPAKGTGVTLRFTAQFTPI